MRKMDVIDWLDDLEMVWVSRFEVHGLENLGKTKEIQLDRYEEKGEDTRKRKRKYLREMAFARTAHPTG